MNESIAKEGAPEKSQKPSERRGVLKWFWKIVGLVALLELGWMTKTLLRYSQTPGNETTPTVIDVGMTDEFLPGTVTPITHGKFHLACLDDGSFLALSIKCTHLGCAVPWEEKKKQFICPCHGSTFDMEGKVLTPPALRPLDSYPVFIENGLVRVDISNPHRR